jgi:NitT/TauT family transport system substrate-binding protein
MTQRRSLLALFYYVFVLSLCPAFHARGAEVSSPRVKIMIAYSSVAANYAPVWIAKELGFFEAHGITAKLVLLRGGVLAIQALVSNEVQFIYAGGAPAVDWALAGADVVILANPNTDAGQSLATRKDIKSLKELKGKTIAVNSLAGPAIIQLNAILESVGLVPGKDVSYLMIGDPPTRLTALRTGNVDATALNPPFTLHAKRAGFNLFDQTNIPILNTFQMPIGSVIARRSYVKVEPAITENVIRATIEGIHFYKTKKTATLSLLRKYLKLNDPEELEETYNRYLNSFAAKPHPTPEASGLYSTHPGDPRQEQPIPPNLSIINS